MNAEKQIQKLKSYDEHNEEVVNNFVALKKELEEARNYLKKVIPYLPKTTSDSCGCDCCKAARYVKNL